MNEQESKIDNEFSLLEKLAQENSLSNTQSCLNKLLNLATNSENPNILSKVKGCVNILRDFEKDIEIRQEIVSSVVDDFFPLLHKGDFTRDDIKEIANQFGGIILEHEKEDNFNLKCSEGFVKTIILTELIENN